MKLSQDPAYQKWLNEDRLNNLKVAEYWKEVEEKKQNAKLLKHSYHQQGIYTRISVKEKKKLRR